MALTEPLASTEIDHITEIRHDLHAHPELGYEEHRTSAVVQRELSDAGIDFVPGLAGGTGVAGYLPATLNPASAKTVALRADMDCLPIHEATGAAYASTSPGKMHACGHDGHTSILIGAARRLAKTVERPNNVLFVFQPAEEGGAGGKRLCEEGVVSGKVIGKPADMIFGLHGFSFLKVGQIATCTGPMLAAADWFTIEVRGRGGHAAMPNAGVDPIVVASHIVTALQSIASRNVSPLDSIVVTIGIIQAGTAHNIIPDTASMVGTLRTLRQETRELGARRIEEICKNVAAAFGASAEIDFTYGYPVTENDPVATRRLRSVLSEAMPGALAPDDVQPVMGGEDFSFYGRHVPACFYWLGLLNEGQERYPNLHAPDFDFNDKALPVGIDAMCALALAPLT
ncbi:MAG TPA: amidohydrolase [Fimbriimonadaceae bacterium]|nr:amidohydrolase [Fimbriimonadaceae bacterium]